MTGRRDPHESDEKALLRMATGRSSPTIGAAMADLNRLGYVVGLDGCLTIDGHKVRLQVQGGALVAIVGGATLPWSLFRQALKPKVMTA